MVGHAQAQELGGQQATGSAGAGQATHQQVANSRVEFVQHHNIDMVIEVVTLLYLQE